MCLTHRLEQRMRCKKKKTNYLPSLISVSFYLFLFARIDMFSKKEE